MKAQPIRSCSCGACRAGRHRYRRQLTRAVRYTGRDLTRLAQRDPDAAEERAVPLVDGGYTD